MITVFCSTATALLLLVCSLVSSVEYTYDVKKICPSKKVKLFIHKLCRVRCALPYFSLPVSCMDVCMIHAIIFMTYVGNGHTKVESRFEFRSFFRQCT